MCLYSFIELNSWKKKSVRILVYEGQELLSESREILVKSHLDRDRSILVIPIWFTQQDPQGCHTGASQEGYMSMLAAHVIPHHVFGKLGGGTATVLSLQPQDMIQPEGTSDDSPLQPEHAAQAQSSFSSGCTSTLPIPTTGGNPGTAGATAALAATPQ